MVGKINLYDLEEVLKKFLEERDNEYSLELFRNSSYAFEKVTEIDVDKIIFAISNEIEPVSDDLFIMDVFQFDDEDSVVYDEIPKIDKEKILDFLYPDGSVLGFYLGYSPWMEEAYELNLVPMKIAEDGTKWY
ncbi:MAG: hypothetical protein ACRCWM_09305 [Sarcina sp.]